jgi:predicted Fe-S protein YdhL (DUF1289 family)
VNALSHESTPIVSPCIQVCAIDAAIGLCTGCGRTLDEIARWSSLTDQERARIMRVLQERTASERLERR